MVGFNCHGNHVYENHQRLQDAAERECNRSILSRPLLSNEHLYCEAKWDGLGCWNYTLADSVAWIPCPRYIPGFEKHHRVHHYCSSAGDWEYLQGYNFSFADYNECVETKMENLIIYVNIIGYGVSILTLLIALCIFQILRSSLRNQASYVRIKIHKNLFVSYILCGISWISYYLVVMWYLPKRLQNSSEIEENTIWCIMLHFACQYFVTCNFFWMLCEGFYLHNIIRHWSMSGKMENRIHLQCLIIGWGIPVLIITFYGLTRGLISADTEMCWIFDSCTQWIVFGSIIITLIVNILFFVQLMMVITGKLKMDQEISEATAAEKRERFEFLVKFAKAASVLIPLLGLQFLIIPVEPPEGIFRDILQMFSAVLVSFQGCIVAFVFCFFNKDIKVKVSRQWRNTRTSLLSTFTTDTQQSRLSDDDL